MKKFGIDVSKYNGKIDWNRVKNAGVEFAILRIGYTGYGSSRTKATDPNFETYYKNAKAAGMPLGGYWFSCACSYEEGVKEANAVLEKIKGKQFEYPIYIDVEDPHHQINASKQAITEAIKGFCETMEKAGYYVGFYCNVDWYNNRMNANELKQYDRWIASWTKTKPSIANRMWQFGGEQNLIRSNKVDGISDNVTDCNYCYYDYPGVIKKAHLNGYTSEKVESNTNTSSKQETAVKVPDLSKYKGVSVVDGLNSVGYDSSFNSRKALYRAVGYIDVYKGTAVQNLKLLNKLKGTTNITSTPKVSYYKKCSSKYASIVDALKSIGVNSSFSNRKKIAAKNNIKLYVGLPSQNNTMLKLLKEGKLVK